jgi:hypothetical protein
LRRPCSHLAGHDAASVVVARWSVGGRAGCVDSVWRITKEGDIAYVREPPHDVLNDRPFLRAQLEPRAGGTRLNSLDDIGQAYGGAERTHGWRPR